MNKSLKQVTWPGPKFVHPQNGYKSTETLGVLGTQEITPV